MNLEDGFLFELPVSDESRPQKQSLPPNPKVHQKPPPLHSTPKIATQPMSFVGQPCLTGTEWRKLADWLQNQRSTAIRELLGQARKERVLATKLLNESTLTEAAKLAKVLLT